jgi:hypothetical protein
MVYGFAGLRFAVDISLLTPFGLFTASPGILLLQQLNYLYKQRSVNSPLGRQPRSVNRPLGRKLANKM